MAISRHEDIELCIEYDVPIHPCMTDIVFQELLSSVNEGAQILRQSQQPSNQQFTYSTFDASDGMVAVSRMGRAQGRFHDDIADQYGQHIGGTGQRSNGFPGFEPFAETFLRETREHLIQEQGKPRPSKNSVLDAFFGNNDD